LKTGLSDFGHDTTSEHFRFSFGLSAAKRLRFDLKEKQWLSEMENDARGHPKTFAH
jgi:hypothetical protein